MTLLDDNERQSRTIMLLREQLKTAEARIAMLEDPTPPEHADPVTILYHLKRRSQYQVEDRSVRVQCETPLTDNEFVVVYRDTKTGARSVRRASEIADGRFGISTTVVPYVFEDDAVMKPHELRTAAHRALNEVPALEGLTAKTLDCILIVLWLYGLKLVQGRDPNQATPTSDSPALAGR